MKIRAYQLKAATTDQVPGSDREAKDLMVPLLGLAGETGTLLTEYKKWLREGSAYQIFKERIAEEIGDILWYISNIATKEGLNLETIASENLKKARDRWSPNGDGATCFVHLFDEEYGRKEQFPRKFRIEMVDEDGGGRSRVRMAMDGKSLGDSLTDNAYSEDGYRYHDIFHLSYAAVLGWSPVIRKLMGCKRKSNKKIDEVEDGGRATAIEEGISALVFDYAKDHSFLEGVDHIDYGILRTIKQLTRNLEVAERSEFQWQDAILKSFGVWRKFKHYGRGVLVCDLEQRTIAFEALPATTSRTAKSKSPSADTSPAAERRPRTRKNRNVA